MIVTEEFCVIVLDLQISLWICYLHAWYKAVLDSIKHNFSIPSTKSTINYFLNFIYIRGDYRTGKRLNMRKVIPYIASQFRKDKIWMRRTKKNKRHYQIMMAVDDSSSMGDNHSKQVRKISVLWKCYLSVILLVKILPFVHTRADIII